MSKYSNSESDTGSTFTATNTFTTLSTVPGLGYLSGKGLKREGDVVVHGVDAMIIRTRLVQIESALTRTSESKSLSLTLRPLYSDLLELDLSSFDRQE